MDDLDPTLLFYVRYDMAAIIDQNPELTLEDAFNLAIKNNDDAQSYLKDLNNENNA